MSIPAEDTNVDAALLSDAALYRLLDEAELEERSLSDRRRELHNLIDARYMDGTGIPTNDSDLAELSHREREISAARLQLHQRILDLRLEKSRRAGDVRLPERELST